MSDTILGYFLRAEECAKLAELASDHQIKRALNGLRQTYLRIAARMPDQAAKALQMPAMER